MPLWLADTSAWHRSGEAEGRWTELLELGEVAVCSPVLLELLFSARGKGEYDRLARDLARLPHLPLDERVARAAARTQAALAARGQHRAPRPVDLLVAGVAEVNGATLLHHDRHFQLIAGVTGQPAEWLPPRPPRRRARA